MITMSYKENPSEMNGAGSESSPFPTPARWHIACKPRSWRPLTDVYETDQAVIVKVEIPGMQEGNFSISIHDRILVIRGSRPNEMLARRAYLQMEIPFGEFRTEIDLPFEVESQEIEADYRDGFLRVILPKPPSERGETGA